MNRTFHSKVDGWYWMMMAVTAFLLFDFFWFHYTLLAVLAAAVMVFEIEMLVHTRYVVTVEGTLEIKSGRFVPDRAIGLSSIKSMRRVRSVSIAPALSLDRVEVVYLSEGENKKVQVSPQNGEEFIRWIEKRKQFK